MDKLKCNICNIYFTDSSNLDLHIRGSHNQSVLQNNLTKDTLDKYSIHINGLPPTSSREEISFFFSKFGQVKEVFTSPNNSYGVVRFSSENVAKYLINRKNIYFNGRRLFVKCRYEKSPGTSEPRTNKITNKINFTSIPEEIKKLSNFDQQLDKLVCILQVDKHTQYVQVYNTIQYYLSQIFRNCSVKPFGSIVSGLGFKNSDIDIFVEYFNELDQKIPPETRASKYIKKAKSIFWQSKAFRNIILIPKAKTPLIKLIHSNTGISCDINFKSTLGVYNTNLIKYLLSLDARLRPFMFIIKFWARTNFLSSSGKLSNYSIVMLIIFYLQQVSILPPLEFFFNKTDNLVEGWNANFEPKIIPDKYKINNSSIIVMLGEFFEFWTKFDFAFNVICPLTAQVILKSDFLKPEALSESFYLYKNNLDGNNSFNIDAPICLQDPIELNRNVTTNVALKTLQEFLNLCEISSTIVKAKNNKDILPELLTKLNVPKVNLSHNNYTFKIPLILTKFCDDKDSKTVQEQWFEMINEFLNYVLTKILLLQVTETQQNISKAQKLDKQIDVHDNNIINTFIFHCVGYKNVWASRRKIGKSLKHLQNNIPFLEKENKISEYIVNVLCPGVVKESIVDFNLTLNHKINPTEAEFVLINMDNKKSSFQNMATYIICNIPIWWKKHNNQIVETTPNNNEIIVETKTSNNEVIVETKFNNDEVIVETKFNNSESVVETKSNDSVVIVDTKLVDDDVIVVSD